MTHGDGGKGSARRKENAQAILNNWDLIFGSATKNNKEKSKMDAWNQFDDEHIEQEHDEGEWTCASCGGPMYRQAHWNYAQCDDCGARQELEDDI